MSTSKQLSVSELIKNNSKERICRIRQKVTHDFFSSNHKILIRKLREYLEYLKGWLPHYDFELWDKVENQFNFIWPQLSKLLYLAIEYDLYEEIRDLFFEIRNLLQWTGRIEERIYFSAWLQRKASEKGDIGAMYVAMSSLAWSYTSSGCRQNLDKASELWKDLALCLANIDSSSNFKKNLKNSLGENLYSELMMDIHENGVRIAIRLRQIDDAEYYIKKGRERISSLFREELILRRLEVRFMVAFQYHEGITYYLKHNYTQAEKIFEDILSRARLIGWDRVIKGARSWLATLAIELKKYDKCNEILSGITEDYPVLPNKRDGFCLLLKAQLSDIQGQKDEKLASEERAFRVFERISENSSGEPISCNINSFTLLSCY